MQDEPLWIWQPVNEPNQSVMKSWRMRVPGGWLVRTVFDPYNTKQANAIAMTFVPESVEVKFS